jgi:DNA-directed RNA polymerase subunit RPC12/RpoP
MDEKRPDVKVEVSRRRGVLVCPVCGSRELVIIGIAGITPPLYLCKKCGHTTYLPLEVFPE